MLPATLHTGAVVEAKLTGSPELAAALIGKGLTPKTTSPNGANEMDCELCTVTTCVEVLSVGFESRSGPETVAVTVYEPGLLVNAVTETVAEAVPGSAPKSHTNGTATELHVPRVVEADISVKEAGRVTTTCASVAVAGPAFELTIVRVTLEPVVTGLGVACDVADRSTVAVPVKLTT